MKSDTDYLSSRDVFGNVCLVKRIDPTTKELVPTHIIFNYWFGCHSIQLRANPTKLEHHYNVVYKDKLLCKDTDIKLVENQLSKYDIITRKPINGKDEVEIIKRSTNKYSKRKKKQD